MSLEKEINTQELSV